QNVMITPSGAGSTVLGGTVGIGALTPGAQLEVDVGTSSTVGQLIKAKSGQSADLFQVLDGSGSKQTYIDSAGQLHGSGAALTGIPGTISGLTVGGVPYASSGSGIATDASNFTWDSTNHRLGLGIASPSELLHLKGSNTGIRIESATTNARLVLAPG